MRRIAISLAVAALGLYGLGCGEKDEPDVTTAPVTTAPPTTTTPAKPPATTTTVPAKQP